MKINADKVKVNGPQVDGGFSVTFYVGEYEQDKVAELMKLPQGKVIELEINSGNKSE